MKTFQEIFQSSINLMTSPIMRQIKYNILHSGRQWFGEQFDQTLQLTIQFDLAGIVLKFKQSSSQAMLWRSQPKIVHSVSHSTTTPY